MDQDSVEENDGTKRPEWSRPLQMANQNMARRSLRGEHYDLNNFRALVNYLKSDHITVDREPETQHISFDIDVAN
jgi:tRNA G37 N-methylase TrmD